MKCVVQRVSEASVTVADKLIGKIDRGLLVLVGIAQDDTDEDLDWMCRKLVNMRIFEDEAQNMNLSVNDVKGDLLLVSQFTLQASTKKGNRPSFINAARPEMAEPMFNDFVKQVTLQSAGNVATGQFGAMMEVALINNGPVTIVIDSKNRT